MFVIGAGIAGLTLAGRLCRRGRPPVIVEASMTAGSSLSLAGLTSTPAGQLWAAGGSYATGSTDSQTLTARYS
jgi:2-polyprenyl-6-methoxyphenol hydroxylase-like FAD-dependent oxidoreductase